MPKVAHALRNTTRLGVDTPAFIYYIEEDPLRIQVLDEVYTRIDSGSIHAVTSTLTLAEVLPHPIKTGNRLLAETYRERILRAANVTSFPVTSSVAETAAELRAKYGIRTPDSIQIARALNQNCDAFLTNDKGLKRLSELGILLVDELEL